MYNRALRQTFGNSRPAIHGPPLSASPAAVACFRELVGWMATCMGLPSWMLRGPESIVGAHEANGLRRCFGEPLFPAG